MSLNLMSPAFDDGAIIPRQFTCDGINSPPPLRWSTVPDGTRSLVLTMEDIDVPAQDGLHWVLYDIPPNALAWPGPWSGKTIVNRFGRSGYEGPCPGPGEAPHQYLFTIHALNIRHLELTGGRSASLRTALGIHVIAYGRLLGRYGR